MLVYWILPCLLTILSFAFYLFKSKYDYWKIRCVPHLKPSYLFGNYKDYILLKKYSGFIAQDICREFPNEPYIGTYYGTEPALLIQDPQLIKLVLIKEFSTFSGREVSKYSNHECITKCMFFTGGEEWRIHRQNSSLLFTSSKTRNMFHLIKKCGGTFEEQLRKEATYCQKFDAKKLAARYTLDCIGSCALGVNTQVMPSKETSNMFVAMGAEVYSTTTLRSLKLIVRSIWPAIFYALRFKIFAPEIYDFFYNTLIQVFQSRSYQESSRNDFVDLFISWKNKSILTGTAIGSRFEDRKLVSMPFTNELLVAQCVQFFAAGFETSSTTMSVVLYELAKNKDIQHKVIDEVDEYLRKNNGVVEYECIHKLPYLEACINETMRIYPLFGILTRETMDDYTLPTGLRLAKGLRIHIPVYHLHHNPEYFPNPEKFIPERFYGEEMQHFTPYTFLPFGEGPRICLGIRFAKMQMYTAFLTIFKDYEVELMEDMPKTLRFAPAGIVTKILDDINLKFTKRNGGNENNSVL